MVNLVNISALPPDYSLWSKKAYWTFDEATALALGRDPERVTWANIKPYIIPGNFEKKFSDIREMIHRSDLAGEFRNTTAEKLREFVKPHFFLDWVKKNEIEFPLELEELIIKRNTPKLKKWKKISKSELENMVIKPETNHKVAGYTTPYLELMHQAIIANGISAQNQGKKESLKDWFLNNAISELQISDRKADVMATLIRLPESSVGGNKKPSKI